MGEESNDSEGDATMETRTPARQLTFSMNDTENEARLRELILYVTQKCGNERKFGATKLNKVLFYSDFYSYARFGRAITGVAYQKLKNGPAPKRLVPVRDEMERAGELQVYEQELYYGGRMTRFVPLRKPDMSLFSGDYVALVDEIMDSLRDKPAEVVSEESHLLPAWKFVELGDLIPYEYVFLAHRSVAQSDIEWADAIAAERAAGLR